MTENTEYLDFIIEQDSAASASPLDLFSTSPTLFGLGLQSSALRCENGAPFFAYKRAGSTYQVVQGSCNSWTCPRCGVMVAKKHYGRIVQGARELSVNEPLYFLTITCRGRDLSVKEAVAGYGEWTSKLIDACYSRFSRAKAKTARVAKKTAIAAPKSTWAYVQVTELQKRGHPHSHFLTTFKPHDLVAGKKKTFAVGNDGVMRSKEVDCLRSEWFEEQCVASGLGEQYDISEVRNAKAAATYVAKYMFKPAQFQAHYPKRWKRVRFSNDYPKLPDVKTDAFVLLSREDWQKLARVAVVVRTSEPTAYEAALYFLQGHDTLVGLFERKDNDD